MRTVIVCRTFFDDGATSFYQKNKAFKIKWVYMYGQGQVSHGHKLYTTSGGISCCAQRSKENAVLAQRERECFQ